MDQLLAELQAAKAAGLTHADPGSSKAGGTTGGGKVVPPKPHNPPDLPSWQLTLASATAVSAEVVFGTSCAWQPPPPFAAEAEAAVSGSGAVGGRPTDVYGQPGPVCLAGSPGTPAAAPAPAASATAPTPTTAAASATARAPAAAAATANAAAASATATAIASQLEKYVGELLQEVVAEDVWGLPTSVEAGGAAGTAAAAGARTTLMVSVLGGGGPLGS